MSEAMRDDEWKPEIPAKHPTMFEPTVFITAAVMNVLGVVIGAELITRVGVTPNTSIIGAVVAMALGRIPLAFLSKMRSVHRQNLIQTCISGATFGGANAIMLPMGILWLMGKPELVPIMFVGAVIGLLVDTWILYKAFDTPAFPASGIWPPGVASAETIIAGDVGGKRALTLLGGAVAGGAGSWFGIPMDVFGVCWIGNVWALLMFGVGLILRGNAKAWFNVDVNALYLPHGLMIGAGVIALFQISRVMFKKAEVQVGGVPYTRGPRDIKVGFGGGFLLYIGGAILIAALSGIMSDMSIGMLLLWILFAAVAAEVSEVMVGLSAMHAGWFPAFATTLIFLILGMLIGFPAIPLALLTGYTASTGPAFADMGYDLKGGWLLRGRGAHPEFEKAGRWQQYLINNFGFLVAIIFLVIFYKDYFSADMFPPVDRVFVATIKAGTKPEILQNLLIWAIPGALIQLLGGAERQMGILLATGFLINNPMAGYTAVAALAIRVIIMKVYGKKAESPMFIMAGGFIAGSAIVSFLTGTMKALSAPVKK